MEREGQVQPDQRNGHFHCIRLLSYAAVTTGLLCGAVALGQQSKLEVLRIGTSGTLTPTSGNEKENLKSLQSFVKDETGYPNEIIRQKGWSELAAKMARGELQLGVFLGYEFAWAQEKYPALAPLALAVNIYRYPVVHIVARRDDSAGDFAALQGHSIAIPNSGLAEVQFFVERQTAAFGKKPQAYFSSVSTPENVEDALDDLVDGKVQSVATDRAALDAYKQQKPGRFNRLKEVAHSQPFPSPLVAYYGTVLDEPTLQQFRRGLLNANQSDRGQTLLTLFRLTAFESVPPDFARVLVETRKAYPPPAQ
jgi:ABC-type phosphate/phosphonate transport system substrate-binding protein